jgi:TonB family protein
MAKSLRKHEVAVPEPPERPALAAAKKTKLAVLLVTEDDELWPLIGADLSVAFALKQLDSIDELITSTPSGQAAIVLWDARNNSDHAAVLSRLHLHSSRYAIIVLDDAISTGAWTIPIQQRQVVAHVGVPLTGNALTAALDGAHEEVNSRLALLGDGVEQVFAAPSTPKKKWLVPAVIGGVLAAAVVVYLLTRHSSTDLTPTTTAAAPANTVPAVQAPGKSAAEIDEKVDALIQKAQQAMLDRHFIDPASGSALSLYREVLIVDPDNGEARQGLQRLSEILIARVQAALDDRKFDVALQFLETARSIDASDPRLSALDEKIANLRAELGPAQILAALNAQNFDRASQLIDEAGRTKALPLAKLNQLRDEVHRRRDEFEAARLLKLVDTRAQQDHLIDPPNDSAVYYLDQAKQAGATAPALQAQVQGLTKRIAQMTHAAIEQRHFSDADRMIADLHGIGAPAPAVAALQRELNSARNQLAAQKPDVPQYLELAQARLAQGKLTEPENDSALYYLNQGRAADPKSSGLAQLSGTLQAQILDRARAALDAGDLERSEALAQSAGGLGGSADLDTLNERIRQKKVAGGDVPQLPEQSLTRLNKLDVQYPPRALQDNIEGWAEVAYIVKPDGSVTNVRVVNAAPSKIFDSSASRAVSRLRYQPVVQGGKAVAIRTEVRIVYRVPK